MTGTQIPVRVVPPRWSEWRLRAASYTLCFLAITACSPIYFGPTGYQKQTEGRLDGLGWYRQFGYTDRSIGSDEYIITFTGNPFTNPQRTADLAMLRVAQIAQQNGRTHFMVITQTYVELSASEDISLRGGYFGPVKIGQREVAYPNVVVLIRLIPTDQAVPAGALEAATVIRDTGARLNVSLLP